MTPAMACVLLLLGHLLADYALQGDFMAKAKNHRAPIPGVPWFTVLLSHAAIHALFVTIVTANIVLAVLEFVGHALTDWAKCDGRISYNVDQTVHIGMKLAYVGIMFAS